MDIGILSLLISIVKVRQGIHSVQGNRLTMDHPELAYKLLASLPRSRLAAIQRRIVPLLQFDVVGVSTTRVFHLALISSQYSLSLQRYLS